LQRPGGTSLDAVEAAIKVMEDSPRFNAGKGAVFTRDGHNELDASIMEGKERKAGAVANVRCLKNPIAAARAVMEKSPYVLLAGRGAELFATQQGVEVVDPAYFWTKERWLQLKEAQQAEKEKREKGAANASHSGSFGTVGAVAVDRHGNLAAGTSTGGLTNRISGRVGDSPLIGHGLYVDNTAGSAGGTGVGEEIIRVGGSLTIVEAMRAGKSPQEACEFAVRKVNALAVRRGVHPANVAFLALDPKGRVGAACTARTNFEYAVAVPGTVELRKAKELGPEAQ
jgi:isoaspartyl peptidase/L-asparaginase-like protein (Ntn-hydrolase superfamily)